LPLFLASLRHQKGVDWEVSFFDNASQDETLDVLKKAGLGHVTAHETNIGYGRAHNMNVGSSAQAPYFLLLNPDLRFGPDLFSLLLRSLEKHPQSGLTGPRILEGPEERPFPPRRFYPGEGMIALEPGLRRTEAAWLSGCCLLVRRAVFERLRGFDPDYFLYQEDTDFCLRARKAGYPIDYAADAVVHHLHRQSQRDLSEYEHARRIFQGSALFWEKHFKPSDVRGMVRFQYWMTRLLLTSARARNIAPQFKSELNSDRLEARRDVCREWLHKRGLQRIGTGGLTTICFRQMRLVTEWIFKGRFPLDDY
jgi:GT2 family glycosyltransferase